MKEYYGKSAKKYKQAQEKRYILTPALIRNLPKGKSGASLLDVGCGDGFFFNIATEKGYEYFGIDVSEDMVKRAKKDYPSGTFQTASAESFTKVVKKKFDVILINMVFPCIDNRKDFMQIFKEAKKALKPEGRILIGTTHSCFDGYMKVGVLGLGLDIINTDFKGYHHSAQKYTVNRNFDGEKFVFEDYHWMISDYINCISECGLKLIRMDECKPIDLSDCDDENFKKKSKQFPIFFVLVVTK